MSTAVLTFGAALIEALEALVMSARFAKDVATVMTGTAELGAEIVTGASKSILALIQLYKGGDHGRLLTGTTVTQAEFTEAITNLQTLLQGNTTPTEAQLKPLVDRILSYFHHMPMFDASEWDSYEIEPPCNPTFKPRKIDRIPDNMDLYEVACPPNFTGVNPQKECTKPKCCKKAKPKCKKRKSKISKRNCCY